jgi:alpha/beta superfamily hydrolase
MKNVILSILLCIAAQNIYAIDLVEKLVTVNLEDGVQQGALSKIKGAEKQEVLFVLIPGHPSIFKPEFSGDLINPKSRLYGNFLVRSREYLIDDKTMTLIVDCYSKFNDLCTQNYQASRQRFNHIKKLIDQVKSDNPTINQVWLVGTSFGTITSGYSALYGKDYFNGVVHTATIDPTAENSYVALSKLNYKEISIPQLFVHHKNDACEKSKYEYIENLTKSMEIPLMSVTGGYGWKGGACDAISPHGFKGKEEQVMKEILNMIKSKNIISKSV